MIYIVMGVSGCGKSTIGAALAEKLVCPFFDADDFHPPGNIAKMANGQALNDEDRWPWLSLLADKIVDWQQSGSAVLACSALKQSYRDILSKNGESDVVFVYLAGTREVIYNRLEQRKGHFMAADLLQSQFDTLEVPVNHIGMSSVFTVDIDQSTDAIVSEVFSAIRTP